MPFHSAKLLSHEGSSIAEHDNPAVIRVGEVGGTDIVIDKHRDGGW